MDTRNNSYLRLGLVTLILGLTPAVLTTDVLAQVNPGTATGGALVPPTAPAASQPLVAPGVNQPNQIMNQDASAAMEALKARQAASLRANQAQQQQTAPANPKPAWPNNQPREQGDYLPLAPTLPQTTLPAETVTGR